MITGKKAALRRKWHTGAVLLAAVLTSVTTLSRADTPAKTLNDFNQGAELQLRAENAPFYRLTVPDNVWLNSAWPDLRDIRIFDSSGTPVPMSLTAAKQVQDESARVRFVIYPLSQSRTEEQDGNRKIRLKADNGTELTIYNDSADSLARPSTATYLLVPDNKQQLPLPLREVTLNWPQQTGNMQAKASLFSSDDKQNWSPVILDVPLMDLKSGEDTLLAQQIKIPGYISGDESRAKYWLLSVTGDNNQAPPQITTAEGMSSRTVERREVNRFDFVPAEDTDGSMIYSLPNTQSLSRLDFHIDRENTVLPVRIEYRSGTEGNWLPLDNKVLYSLVSDDAENRNSNIRLNDLPVRQVRLTAINSSWRETPPKVTGVKYAQYLTFNAQGSAPYLLVWGAHDASAAFLPLSQLLPGNNLNNQDAIPRADVSEKVVTLGGEAKLLPEPEAPPPFAWKTWLLWGVLVAGVVILGLFAVRLLKEMKTEQK
ncbi:DUF3999 domain-containing protein [Morganella morganii subsp. morganii]|uniref:DUF3999 domain-containing protein n=1 Tax=Morganella TaxID=581 RepID=UPI0008A57A0A|nr:MULTISPECIES: DUF3999 domain-containing protein [Morganella]EKL3976683.1 DUF3999 domain-containing protein [Morganella morganii]ELB1012961.1 DUF3999 domain-containing protein [Morganella morganii]MBA5822573.1 DUF3999 domain-containing protein [Morganella morganii]MBC3978752.1 DUF3999 domain-containing protein [Morganella morganii]MBT0352481.1 DUF3999 domain-containing protein [Morganella morganii subsp. morganii]